MLVKTDLYKTCTPSLNTAQLFQDGLNILLNTSFLQKCVYNQAKEIKIIVLAVFEKSKKEKCAVFLVTNTRNKDSHINLTENNNQISCYFVQMLCCQVH